MVEEELLKIPQERGQLLEMEGSGFKHLLENRKYVRQFFLCCLQLIHWHLIARHLIARSLKTDPSNHL